MDTARFFEYPDDAEPAAPTGEAGFLSAAGEADWAVILEHARTRRYAAGAEVVRAGETDRALYVVLEGTLTTGTVDGDRSGAGREKSRVVEYVPGAFLGEQGFLAGRPAGVPVLAVTVAEVLRLGLSEFEVLAVKEPALGRYLLFDLARVLADRVARAEGDGRGGRGEGAPTLAGPDR